MTTQQGTDDAVTVIIGLHVCRGAEQQFLAWQHTMNAAASRYRGFLAAEVNEPTEGRPDWGVVYRFDSLANLRTWLDSSTRQSLLAAGAEFVDGPPTQQVVSGADKPADQLVTVVVTHRVLPDQVDDFLAWQERMQLAESEFDGYRGAELFRPVEGVQDEWTAMYRYRSAADLEAWLASDTRSRLLEAGKKFSDFQMRTVESSFGSWFAFDKNGRDVAPPSGVKTSVAVWVGLYPTVVLLTLAMDPLHLPLWLGMLVGNLVSSFIMSFVVMPYYVNKLLGRWLWPRPDASTTQTNVRGVTVVAVLTVFWALVFYLVTAVFWPLA
ncbi:antibiotic biosynthesis monooxygenase [Mycolicibacterium mengxianglii]|uniref:antibiotic biosynthesis monooxygenase n=1 Tax=Mycolicibacterium mengxianglii TaxID=2736649 RepID=UPI0018D025D5|nr:antibiotic biosynthesis monooxygenase [Mycolicibacterium mengxianglii]